MLDVLVYACMCVQLISQIQDDMSIDISYFQCKIMGTMSSTGKERMGSEPEGQVESLGDYEDDDIPLLVAFIPDDAQRREVWRRQKLFEDLKIRFAIP